MTDTATDVVEFLLTVTVYNETPSLDAGDLPPRYRRVFWSVPDSDDGDDGDDPDAAIRSSTAGGRADDAPDPGGVDRPLSTTVETARAATGVEQPWRAVADLLFTGRDDVTDTIAVSDRDMAVEWFLKRGADRVAENPTLAHAFGDHELLADAAADTSYEAARSAVRPLRADRVWIDGLLRAYFDAEDEEDREMLDLVDVRAPEEVETTLDDLVLTAEQEEEIGQIATAIEHRDYLADIGLREVGKLLFVGPPGTGKTSIARALARDLDLPIVEVKLSMITSQYLGETAKNVDKTFEVAKRLAPCILFIDEFDSVAKTRRGDEHAAVKRAVNTLLKAIDDVSLVRDEVLLIGATNHPDQLDAAAWRRFDEIVEFPRPDRDMRADIFRVITRRMDLADFDPGAVADATAGMTGSDLRMVLREAVLDALADGRKTVTGDDIEAAVDDFERRDNLKTMDTIDDPGIAGEADDGHDHAPGAGHDDGHDAAADSGTASGETERERRPAPGADD